MDQGACEFPLSNASREEIDRILADARTVAVVGISDKPDRDSYVVARFLQNNGMRIVPINPALDEVLGEKAYASLTAVPANIEIDVVDIFRRPEHVPPIVDEAIARAVKVVWMQLGIANNAAGEKARAAGLQVVMDRCIKVELARFKASKK